MDIYVVFYEAYTANWKTLFSDHVIVNSNEKVTNGTKFMVDAKDEAFSHANGKSPDVYEVKIVGISKL